MFLKPSFPKLSVSGSISGTLNFSTSTSTTPSKKASTYVSNGHIMDF